MNLILIGFIVVVLIITFPMVFKFCLYYDINKNIGYIKIKIFFITVYKADFSLMGLYLSVIKRNKKLIKIKLDANDKYVKFANNLKTNLKNKLYFISFENYNFISMFDSYKVAIHSGIFNTIFSILSVIVYSINPNIKCIQENNISFNGKIYETYFYGSLMVTIFDLMTALIFSFIKEKKNYERKRI